MHTLGDTGRERPACRHGRVVTNLTGVRADQGAEFHGDYRAVVCVSPA